MANTSLVRRAAILSVIVLSAIVVCVLLVIILRPGSGTDTGDHPPELSPAAAALAATPVPEYDEEGVRQASLHLRRNLSKYQGFVDLGLKTLLQRIKTNPRQVAQWDTHMGAKLLMFGTGYV